MMRWRGWMLRMLPCLLAAAFVSSPTASADQLENLRQARENLNRQETFRAERARYEQSLKDLQSLPATRISQLFSLQIENRQITLTPRVKPTLNYANRKVSLDGFNSPATISYSHWAEQEPPIEQLEFFVQDFPDKQTSEGLRLTWQPNATSTPVVSIENTIHGPSDQYQRVQYSQSPAQVLLVGFITDGANPQQDPETITLSERDFLTLRQKHPHETEKWLRPIFRRLQQNSVFAADSNAAWQALVDQWPVSDATAQAVADLTPDLASTDWHKRRHAADALARLGRNGAAAILRLNRQNLTIEQNVQLGEVLSRFSPLPDAELAALRNDPNFLLDCEYSEDITVRRLASDRFQEVTARPSGITIDAPDVMRADMIEQARNRLANH